MPSAHPQDSWVLHESSKQSVNSKHGAPPPPPPCSDPECLCPYYFLIISYITPDFRGTNWPCRKASEHSCDMWLIPHLLLQEDEDLIIDPVLSPAEQEQEGEQGESERTWFSRCLPPKPPKLIRQRTLLCDSCLKKQDSTISRKKTGEQKNDLSQCWLKMNDITQR